MDGKFFVPIATMLAGVVVFVTFAIWYAARGRRKQLSPRVLAGVCLVAGGLVVASGFA
jgi:hypothetical protein